jgi:hypothetical protein
VSSLNQKSGNHKIVSRGSYDHLVDGIFVLLQKDSNAKKESYYCAEPFKECLPSLPLKTRKSKRKEKKRKEKEKENSF